MKELLIIFTPNTSAADKREFVCIPEKKAETENLIKSVNEMFESAKALRKELCVYCETQTQVRSFSAFNEFKKYLKIGSDEGEKMFNAFLKGFIKDFSNIVLLRYWTEEINKKIIEEAFEKLKSHEYVLGPSIDGSYYLVGMKKLDPFIFEEHSLKKKVLIKDMVCYLEKQETSFCLLEELKEVVCH